MQHVLLFDFDGTLGQSLPHWGHAFRDSLLEHGVEVELKEVIQACFGRPSEDVASQFKLANPAAFKERVWAQVLERMPLVDVYPAVHATIRELRQNSQALAVVTNSRRGHVVPVLDRWQLAHTFDTVVTIEDVARGKPSPEPLLLALERVCATPDRAWMIGDSLADIHAAHAAGVRSIAFHPADNHQFANRQALKDAHPTHLVESYDEILAIIQGS